VKIIIINDYISYIIFEFCLYMTIHIQVYVCACVVHACVVHACVRGACVRACFVT